MKKFKSHDLLSSILNDSINQQNDFRAGSDEYNGILELQRSLKTSNYSDKSIIALDSKRLEYEIVDNEIRLILSPEELDAYKWNTETLPYRAGQIHAIMDVVFFGIKRSRDVLPYISDFRNLIRSNFFRTIYFDGFIYQDFAKSIFPDDPMLGFDEIYSLFGNKAGYLSALQYMISVRIVKDINLLLSLNGDLSNTISSQLGIDIDQLHRITSFKDTDYPTIERIANLLSLDTSDENISKEIRQEILETTPEFYTMYIPEIIERHQRHIKKRMH